MTPVQLTLLGIAGAAVFGYLLYRLKRADDRQRSAAQAKEQRIANVVEKYGALARSLESSNLRGMLKAGVRSLLTSDEVEEALRRVDAEGLTPGIPGTYRSELQGADLLVFFRLLQERHDEAGTDAGVRRIIAMTKGVPGA